MQSEQGGEVDSAPPSPQRTGLGHEYGPGLPEDGGYARCQRCDVRENTFEAAIRCPCKCTLDFTGMGRCVVYLVTCPIHGEDSPPQLRPINEQLVQGTGEDDAMADTAAEKRDPDYARMADAYLEQLEQYPSKAERERHALMNAASTLYGGILLSNMHNGRFEQIQQECVDRAFAMRDEIEKRLKAEESR